MSFCRSQLVLSSAICDHTSFRAVPALEEAYCTVCTCNRVPSAPGDIHLHSVKVVYYEQQATDIKHYTVLCQPGSQGHWQTPDPGVSEMNQSMERQEFPSIAMCNVTPSAYSMISTGPLCYSL